MVSKESFKHYKIGYEPVDNEHWAIISLMNDAIVSLKLGQYDTAVPIVHSIEELLHTHFVTEEQLMIKVNFPYTAAHCDEHRRIILELKKVLEFLDKRVLQDHIVDHLESTLMDHIDHYDTQISNFLHK